MQYCFISVKEQRHTVQAKIIDHFRQWYFLQYITFSDGCKGVCKERLRGYSISAQTLWERSTQ